MPVLHNSIRTVQESDGKLMVQVELTRKQGGLLSSFLPNKTIKKIRLDQLGQFVLEKVDGRRNTRDIIEAFVRQYRTNRREAELCVTAFLRSLAERHVISIVIK